MIAALRVALPLVPGHRPSVAERPQQLHLLAGDAIVEEIDSVASRKRLDDPRWKIGIVASVVRGVDDERERREQEVDQLGCVGVVNVRLQLRQEVEGELELGEDVYELLLVRWTRAQRQQTLSGVLLLRSTASAASLQLATGGCCVLQSCNELLDVVEAVIEDGHVTFILLARRRRGFVVQTTELRVGVVQSPF